MGWRGLAALLRPAAVPARRAGARWRSFWPGAEGGAGGDLTDVLDWQPDLARLHAGIAKGLSWPSPQGLTPGEMALAATAAARATGSLATASDHAKAADRLLRQPRDIDALLEEGDPVPLTGRVGAICDLAAAVARPTGALPDATLRRLSAARLDDFEKVDLLFIAAFGGWTDRLSLSLGEIATISPPAIIASEDQA